jgi:bacterial/archaeal transporter family protein
MATWWSPGPVHPRACGERNTQASPADTASKVAPVDKLGVVFAVILAFVFLRERVDSRTIGGCTLIVGGAIVLALK